MRTVAGKNMPAIIASLLFLAGLGTLAEEPKTLVVGEFAADGEGWEMSLGKEFPGAEGNFFRNEEEGVEGKGAACLQGNFSAGGNYVAMTKTLTPPMVLGEVSMRVKTKDLSFLMLRFVDETNQTHQQRIRLADNADWQTITIKNLVGEDHVGHWGGANDGTWHGTARQISIILDRGALKDKDSKKGAVLVDKITVKTR
jgi:hypothetical protein